MKAKLLQMHTTEAKMKESEGVLCNKQLLESQTRQRNRIMPKFSSLVSSGLLHYRIPKVVCHHGSFGRKSNTQHQDLPR